MKTKKIIEVLEFIDNYCKNDCENCGFGVKGYNTCYLTIKYVGWNTEKIKEQLKDVEEL